MTRRFARLYYIRSRPPIWRRPFIDTKYTKKNPSPPAPPAANSSGFTYEPLTCIQGYVSPKRADYFIWELRVFEEGSKVVLGDNLVLARITGIVGVGRNFIKFGVETLGSSFRNKIPVKGMIVSIPPDVFHLSCSQRFCKEHYQNWHTLGKGIKTSGRSSVKRTVLPIVWPYTHSQVSSPGPYTRSQTRTLGPGVV